MDVVMACAGCLQDPTDLGLVNSFLSSYRFVSRFQAIGLVSCGIRGCGVKDELGTRENEAFIGSPG